jgi:nicotinamidase-related amidase
MTLPATLFSLSGVTPTPSRLPAAALVLIDMQNEYLKGPLALPDAEAAVANAARLLALARATGARVIHVAHRGRPGGLFDPDMPRSAIIDTLAPGDGEAVVWKTRPNAFSGTDLMERLGGGDRLIILAGFMTHMCVSSTARAALDLGVPVTLVADACATRDLPAEDGTVIDHRALHAAAIAALADRFVSVARTANIVMEPAR